MPRDPRTRFLSLVFVAAGVAGGCSDSGSAATNADSAAGASASAESVSIAPPPRAVSATQVTIDEICDIASLLLEVPPETVQPSKTFADLQADDQEQLDVILEIQERFDIPFTDEMLQTLGGSKDFPHKLGGVTLKQMADVVERARVQALSAP